MRIINSIDNKDYNFIISRPRTAYRLAAYILPKPLSRFVMGIYPKIERIKSKGQYTHRKGHYVAAWIRFFDFMEGKRFFEKRPGFFYGLDENIGLEGYAYDERPCYFFSNKNKFRRHLIARRTLEEIGSDFVSKWQDRLNRVGVKRVSVDVFEDAPNPEEMTHAGTIDTSTGNIKIDMGDAYGFSRLGLRYRHDSFKEQLRRDVEFVSRASESLLLRLGTNMQIKIEGDIVLKPEMQL